jgi:hypothetical protein
MAPLTSTPIVRLTIENLLDEIETAPPAVDGVWWNTDVYNAAPLFGAWVSYHIPAPSTGRERSEDEIDAIVKAVLELIADGAVDVRELEGKTLADFEDGELYIALTSASVAAYRLHFANPTCKAPTTHGECGFPAEPGSDFCRDCDPYREPASIAHNANARTGVYLGDLRDV